MMCMADEHVSGLVWRWIHEKLDEDRQGNSHLLFRLIECPSEKVKKTAIANAVTYKMEEAIPFIEKELNNAYRIVDCPPWIETLGDYAQNAIDGIRISKEEP